MVNLLKGAVTIGPNYPDNTGVGAVQKYIAFAVSIVVKRKAWSLSLPRVYCPIPEPE
jgi:hypothetical protein